ncbi:MAG TPA: methyltransferase type 11 [Gammaproteobacteria bacterium]|nr:methyltransferase type 11 [Gammaproteobacteria bacterium]
MWLDKITSWLGHRRAQRLLARQSTYRGIENWWQTQIGQEMQMATQEELSNILPNLFGYYLLNVGCCSDLECLKSSAIKQKLKVQPDAHVDGQGAVRAEAHALPIASDSVDLVLLNHALGFELHPHQVLREAERVLVPEGHVVVVGFNPLSMWGFWWFLNGFRKSAPWSSNIMSQLRMKDWLKLLGFEVVQTQSCFFRPHVAQSKILARLQFMERFGKRFLPHWGGIYVIVARKKVSCITPVGRVRNWRISKAAPVLVSSSRGAANLEIWDLDQVG